MPASNKQKFTRARNFNVYRMKGALDLLKNMSNHPSTSSVECIQLDFVIKQLETTIDLYSSGTRALVKDIKNE